MYNWKNIRDIVNRVVANRDIYKTYKDFYLQQNQVKKQISFTDTYETKRGKIHTIKFMINEYESQNTLNQVWDELVDYCQNNNLKCALYASYTSYLHMHKMVKWIKVSSR